MTHSLIHTCRDLEELVGEIGFLPLLANGIEGFSIEEHCSPDVWFVDGVEGPWEWKGPVIQALHAAYGRFFRRKAGFVSREWFPHFANVRRGGRTFDELCEEGEVPYETRRVYEAIKGRPPLPAMEWRARCGIRKRGRFDSVVNRLQMLTFVTTCDFDYKRGKDGEPEGWGISVYSTSESWFGEDFEQSIYDYTVDESRALIEEHLARVLPSATGAQIARAIG